MLSRLSVSLALLLAGAFPAPAQNTLPITPIQGTFVTALCSDTQGRYLVATEGQGVWRCEPAENQYTHFTQKDSLGSDDVYALAVDPKGRLWAGTLRGLSVYNGLTWKTYGPAEGLAGFRVFALAICPTDGDVWAATEGGLTRYSVRQGTWRTLSRLDGLPSDAISCLAFTHSGDLYVGTQADGVAFASRKSGYSSWRVTPGPSQMPNAPDGPGLPSSFVNCLLVGTDGTVYVGTDGGLARSRDGGLTWRFTRGANWRQLVQHLWAGPKPVQTDAPDDLMGEDYVTALAEDRAGRLLVGHRRAGLDLFDEAMGHLVREGQAKTSVPRTAFVTAILPLRSGPTVVGFYGGGLAALADRDTGPAQAAKGHAVDSVPPLPAPAAPPTLAQLNTMLKLVRSVAPDPAELQPHVSVLDDDWATEGDWLGRYGRYWACLCACSTPSNYVWGAGWEPVDYAVQVGPNHKAGDSLRYWVQWLYTQNSHTLELPLPYLDTRVQRGLTTWGTNRREAEVDDHGEAYNEVNDGPGIFLTVTVPRGLYVLSLYDNNYNSHSERSGRRDYRLSVRPHLSAALGDITDFKSAPEWAHGRVTQFWGGVWKRFLVRGPVALTVQLDRNHGYNTMLNAAMLDLVDEMPPPYIGTPEQRLIWRNTQRDRLLAQWRITPATRRFAPATSETQAADALFETIQGMQFTNSTWWGVNGRRFYAPLLRWYRVRANAVPHDKHLLSRFGTCCYRLGLYQEWEQCERRAGVTPARDVEKALRFDGVNGLGHGFEAVADYVTHKGVRGKEIQETSAVIAGPEGGGR